MSGAACPSSWRAWWVTVELAVLAIAISLVWGLLIAVLRQWAPAPLRWLAAAYVEIVRNTPILVQIYFIYFGLAVAGVRVTGFGSALIALAAQNGGYILEIYRAGIQSISIKQIESAKALGMRLPTILSMIVLPQAFRHVIPPVGNQSILILKDTSIAATVAVAEMTSGRQDADRAHGGGLRGLLHPRPALSRPVHDRCRAVPAARAPSRFPGLSATMPAGGINNLWYLGLAALNTIGIAAASIVLSAVLGLAVALLHVFGGLAARLFVELYLYIVRGVPLLVLLFTMYYVLPYAGVELGAVDGGILVLGLYFAAFMSEAFRAAILSLPKAQWDAARGLGMRRSLMLRIVIFPQAVRIALPPFVNTCLMLIKSTSPCIDHRHLGADLGRARGHRAHLRRFPDLRRRRAHLLLHLLRPRAAVALSRGALPLCPLRPRPR